MGFCALHFLRQALLRAQLFLDNNQVTTEDPNYLQDAGIITKKVLFFLCLHLVGQLPKTEKY